MNLNEIWHDVQQLKLKTGLKSIPSEISNSIKMFSSELNFFSDANIFKNTNECLCAYRETFTV